MRVISERLPGFRAGAAAGLLAVVITLAVVLAASGATAALRAERVKAWGVNDHGQLGDGTSTERHTPVGVPGLTEADVRAIAAPNSGSHNLALLRNGTVEAWGDNSHGQLGDGTKTPHPTPGIVAGLTGVVAIAAGEGHSLALLSNGTVTAWGLNNVGEVGDGTSQNERHTPVPVKGLTGVRAIAAGGFHSMALLSDGTVKAWGLNASGQVGDGTPTPEKHTPVTVKGLTGVRAVAAGRFHSLALLSDGTVKAWGSNGKGQVGNGTPTVVERTPVPVTGLTGVRAITAGADHSLALRSDGTVRAWGLNGNGQLGDGTSGTDRRTPVPVTGLTGVVAVAAGGSHSLALRSDGTVKAWGSNGQGELGDGTVSGRRKPVTVRTGLPGITGLTAGKGYSLAA